MKVKVYHAGYGCETGCCGHIVELEDGRTRFEFEHPWFDANQNTEEAKKEWARELAEEVIKDNWPDCLASIDWNTMELEVLDD